MRGTRPSTWGDERGYTLPEVLTAVAIAGILAVIAIIILLALLERWRVEAAADQLASDMRLAHSEATQQLTDWRLVMTTGSPDYSLVRLETSHEGGSTPLPPTVETRDRSLPAGTIALSSTANAAAENQAGPVEFYIEFNSDGTAHAPHGPSGNVQVSSDDEDPRCKITFLAATSNVEIGSLVYQ